MTPPALDRVVPDVPRQGPGRPLADGPRRHAAAPSGSPREARRPGSRLPWPRGAGDASGSPGVWRRRYSSRSAILGAAYWRSRAEPPTSMRLSVLPSEGTSFSFIGESSAEDAPAPPAISPDGKRLVFGAQDAGTVRLYVRSLDSFEARPWREPRTPGFPFWSPDGAWIGFFQNGKLKKIRRGRGPGRGDRRRGKRSGRKLEPGRNDRLRAERRTRRSSAYRRREDAAKPVTFRNAPERLRSPSFPLLPAGWATLPVSRDEDRNVEERPRARTSASSSARRTRDRLLRLLSDVSNAIYAPPGFILFRREGTLMALPFDAKALKVDRRADSGGREDRVRGSSLLRSLLGVGDRRARSTGRAPVRQPLRLSWLDRSGKAAGLPEVPPELFWDVAALARWPARGARDLRPRRRRSRSLDLRSLSGDSRAPDLGRRRRIPSGLPTPAGSSSPRRRQEPSISM